MMQMSSMQRRGVPPVVCLAENGPDRPYGQSMLAQMAMRTRVSSGALGSVGWIWRVLARARLVADRAHGLCRPPSRLPHPLSGELALARKDLA